jgi:hypothetical protein
MLAAADNYGKYVKDRWVIARAYLRGWFILDLISTIPLELLLQSEHVNAMQLFRVRPSCCMSAMQLFKSKCNHYVIVQRIPAYSSSGCNHRAHCSDVNCSKKGGNMHPVCQDAPLATLGSSSE